MTNCSPTWKKHNIGNTKGAVKVKLYCLVPLTSTTSAWRTSSNYGVNHQCLTSIKYNQQIEKKTPLQKKQDNENIKEQGYIYMLWDARGFLI